MLDGEEVSIAAASDAVLSNPQNNQVLTYNSGTAKWVNATPSGGPSVTTSVLQIDDFAGATDDAKHVAAWASAASATRKPILQYPARTFGPLLRRSRCFRVCGQLAQTSTGVTVQRIKRLAVAT